MPSEIRNPNLPPCPICGAAAVTVHMYSTYDRADFGWRCGCPRYSIADKHHPPGCKVPEAQGLTKEAAEENWIEKVRAWNE